MFVSPEAIRMCPLVKEFQKHPKDLPELAKSLLRTWLSACERFLKPETRNLKLKKRGIQEYKIYGAYVPSSGV